jgi:hypothetical protein
MNCSISRDLRTPETENSFSFTIYSDRFVADFIIDDKFKMVKFLVSKNKDFDLILDDILNIIGDYNKNRSLVFYKETKYILFDVRANCDEILPSQVFSSGLNRLWSFYPYGQMTVDTL